MPRPLQGRVDPQRVGSNDRLTDHDPVTGELLPWLAPGRESNSDEPVGVAR
jgi:hypothetical protein